MNEWLGFIDGMRYKDLKEGMQFYIQFVIERMHIVMHRHSEGARDFLEDEVVSTRLCFRECYEEAKRLEEKYPAIEGSVEEYLKRFDEAHSELCLELASRLPWGEGR